MKANELSCKDLMIGDWVIFHDSGYASDGTTWKEDMVCQIDAIDVDIRVKWYDEDGYEEDWPHVNTFCLSPIPLTAEILEKNGWKYEFDKTDYMVKYDLGKEGKNCWMMWSIKEHNLDVQRQDKNLDIYNLKVSRVVINCDFVHQLQHALKLCGIEKEIEL